MFALLRSLNTNTTGFLFLKERGREGHDDGEGGVRKGSEKFYITINEGQLCCTLGFTCITRCLNLSMFQ